VFVESEVVATLGIEDNERDGISDEENDGNVEGIVEGA